MTTIIVCRTAPDPIFQVSLDIKVTLHASDLPKTWSWLNIVGMIPTSLSGEKGDYNWNYDIPTATLSLSNKLSYQQRFCSKQADFNNLKSKLVGQITKLEEKIMKLEEKLDNRLFDPKYYIT